MIDTIKQKKMGLNEELARKMKELMNLNNKVSTPGSSKGSSNSY